MAQFPRTVPSADSDVDIPQLLGQARSRYKALCARLGVKPSLRLSTAGGEAPEDEGDVLPESQPGPSTSRRPRVWELESDTKADLSF